MTQWLQQIVFFVMKRLQQNGYEVQVNLQKENIVDLYSINKFKKKNEREKTTKNKQMIIKNAWLRRTTFVEGNWKSH